MGMKWQVLGDRLPRTRNPLTRVLGRVVFRAMGWRIEGQFPNQSKVVVALTPHTSNMDFILTIAVLWSLGLKSSFLMKQSLFWFPLGPILKALGGIPVDRSQPRGLVDKMTQEFQQRAQLVLGITPEGTRSGVRRWKHGFARIAESAQVPVLPAVLNYKTRTVLFAAIIDDVFTAEDVLARVKQASLLGCARSR